eukprot:6199704-Pleurochrysis_carterae.AAC.3
MLARDALERGNSILSLGDCVPRASKRARASAYTACNARLLRGALALAEALHLSDAHVLVRNEVAEYGDEAAAGREARDVEAEPHLVARRLADQAGLHLGVGPFDLEAEAFG